MRTIRHVTVNAGGKWRYGYPEWSKEIRNDSDGGCGYGDKNEGIMDGLGKMHDAEVVDFWSSSISPLAIRKFMDEVSPERKGISHRPMCSRHHQPRI